MTMLKSATLVLNSRSSNIISCASDFKRSFAALFFVLLTISIICFTSPHVDLPKDGEILIISNQTGSDLTKTIAKAIDSAEKSIVMSIYSLTDEKVVSILNKKAEDGIEIFLYTDAHASWPGMKHLHKFIHVHLWKTSALMHQKILIIDENTIYMGSANFTWNSLNVHQNLIIAFKSPEAAEFLKGHLDGSDYYQREVCPHKILFIGEQRADLTMFPNKLDTAHTVLEMISSAKKSIKVAMYTWTRPDFAIALAEAKTRGVDVEIVLDRSFEKEASNSVREILSQENITMRIYQGPGLLHHKFIWVDDETLLSGSVNWTKAAYTKNREYTLLLHHLTSEQKRALRVLWESL